MKILVTGGAGFIGSWIVRCLLNLPDDHSVVNLDLLTYAGNLDNLRDVENHPRYQFVHGDIRDQTLVSELMSQVDTCIHAAAETHVDRSITNPARFIETNILGTHVLMEAARHYQLKKFVLVSTDEVYGSLTLESTEKFTENTPLKPNSPYAASKASADLLALSYFKTFDFPVCITRCGNNYGPYQYPEKLIPFFILNALQGQTVPVYGDGLNVRDWIFVEDHAQAVLAVLFKGISGNVYNVGASIQQNNLEMTKTILRLLQKPETLMRFVSDRPGHDRRYALDTSKISAELGWLAQHPFETALAQTVAWYQNNAEWIANIQERQQREQIKPGAAWLISELPASHA